MLLAGGSTAAVLAVVAACSVPEGETSEIDAFERAVRAQTKDDARAFIETFQTSHLIGDLIESLRPDVALQVCGDLPAAASRAAGPCEALRQLEAMAPAAARPRPTAPSRPAQAAIPAPPREAAIAASEPVEIPPAARPEPEPAVQTAAGPPEPLEAITAEPIEVEVLASAPAPAAIQPAAGPLEPLEAITIEPIEVEVLTSALAPAAIQPLMIAPEPAARQTVVAESAPAPDAAPTETAAPPDSDKLEVETAPLDAESKVIAGDIAGPAAEAALAKADADEQRASSVAPGVAEPEPRPVQVVEANRGGSTADWLIPPGAADGSDEEVVASDDDAGFARGRTAAKVATKEDVKTKTKDAAKTNDAVPAVGKDKDSGSGLANAAAQRGKDKDADGGGDGGRDGKN
jgi:hypothetical protein